MDGPPGVPSTRSSKKDRRDRGSPTAFVFVTPEYNYGTSAVLKNALRLGLSEWNRKGGWLRELWLRNGRTRRPTAGENR